MKPIPLTRLLNASVLLLLLAACASPTATPTPGSSAAVLSTPPAAIATQPAATPRGQAAEAGLFLARPGGAAGPLVAYDLASGAARYTLPAGRLSADGKHYFASAQAGQDTRLDGYDLGTGLATPRATLPGAWELSAVSPTGQWAALTRAFTEAERQQWPADGWQTQVQIVDAQTGAARPAISLDGNFEVDGLSRGGDALYVIEYLPAAKPDHYQVRLYDLKTKALQDGALVDKSATDEVMAGDRWEAVGSPNGEWLLTLYLQTKKGEAFIHALQLEGRFTLCLDLPSGDGSLDKLKSYSLALAPGGQVLYAANPALGIVAKVDLTDFSVIEAARFTPAAEAMPAGAAPASRSAMAPDGHTLYFTDGTRAWAYGMQTGQVNLLAQAAPITGLGVSADSQRLYVSRLDQPLLMLDAASGQPVSFQAR